MELISYPTLLDAARQHFAHVAGSALYTRAARQKALELYRNASAELDVYNRGKPLRAFYGPELASAA